MISKWIVITSINNPTDAIREISLLCEREDWNCVVVGDAKTPTNWTAKNIDFLSVDNQLDSFEKFGSMVPLNHYARKNIGYLYAIEQGSSLILDTDDDNIPLSSFGSEIKRDITGQLVGNSKWVNIYRYFTKDPYLWPRGNPLNEIHSEGIILDNSFRAVAPIQQYLADGDPDVDAIYRLIFKKQVFFEKNKTVFLDKGSWCSFNSQNTIFFKEVFCLLYLPSFVSFRMTDIWRSFIAQNIIWSIDSRVSFSSPTVQQIRNEHNLLHDFSLEVDGYLNNNEIVKILWDLKNTWTTDTNIHQKLWESWYVLFEHEFIPKSELSLLNEWLRMLK